MGSVEGVKERLLQLLKAERMSQVEFAGRMGVSPGYVAAMRRSMPPQRVERLMELFPTLNRDWLLYGEGDMYLTDSHGEKVPAEYVVPLLPVAAFAGSLTGFADGIDPRDCEKVISPVKSADWAIPIKGDSMEPRIREGSTLFIRKLESASFINWGQPMVVDTENGALLKLVYPSEKGEDYIQLRSYNPDYPPFDIPTDSIYALYKVLCTVDFINPI